MKSKKWLLIVVLILIPVIFLVMRNRKKDIPYTYVNAKYGSITRIVSANGLIKPRNRLEIKPPFAGRVEDILVREGERITKGRILAWMSSLDRAALLDAARAKGKEEAKKWEDVYKPTPIIAPLSGFIIKRDIEPGQTVSAQDALLVMADKLIVQADVDETDIGKLKLQQQAGITLDAYPDKTIRGSIEHVAYESQIVNNVTIYRVDILPESALKILRSGMSASIEITIAEKKDILTLLLLAVKENNGMKYAFVKSKRGEPEKRNITTGIDDGINVEIISGLEKSDTVVINPPKERTPFKRKYGGIPGMRKK